VRYFLYGYYGYGNFGDDLLLQGVIEGIRSRDAHSEFFVYSLNDVQFYASDPSVKFTRLAHLMENIRTRPARFTTYLAGLGRWISGSDVFVIGGGTLFIDKGGMSVSLLVLYLAILWAKLWRKPVVIIGVGVDCLTHPVSRWLTKRIMGAADFVAVRDSLSQPYVSHRHPEQTRLSADLALSLKFEPLAAAPPRFRPVLGFCFIDYYRTVDISEVGHARYEAAIKSFLESCKKHYNLLCITFQRGIGQRDDWLEPMLRAHFPDANIVHVDTLEAARSMAARVDVLVTMRFHLGILGIMWGKPIVIIDHEQKMAALAKDFSLPSISLQEFISGAQLDMQGLLATYDANRTSARLAIERDRVATNFEWMLKSRGS